MEDLLTIELRKLRFFAYHGLYPEEKKAGNDFEVDLFISFYPLPLVINHLSETIDYASVFELVMSEMQKPRELLETLAMEITELIHNSFSQVKRIEINIVKLNPPIRSLIGTMGVRYSKEWPLT